MMHHRYQQHRWQGKTPAANFATGTAGVVDTDGKLLLVSMTQVANNGNNIRLLTS
jgi:hypothetical protein